MSTEAKDTITVEATINAPAEKVWKYWTDPEHIIKWNSPSEEWHTPRAEADLRVGGRFISRMEARDGSIGFDFEGTYEALRPNEYLAYSIADGRKVSVTFTDNGDNSTGVSETFEPEHVNPREMQQAGWQAILENFKKYTEAS